MNLLALLLKSGIVGYIIILLSIVAIAIIIERFRYFGKSAKITNEFINLYENYIEEGNMEELESLCRKYLVIPEARIAIYGIKNSNNTKGVIKEIMTTTAYDEIKMFEKGFDWLSTIASVAPLLGFLGTVAGMIQAFMKIQSLGGTVNASDLAGGIWVALITTALGLTVGIITLFFYNVLVAKLERKISNFNQLISLLLTFKESKEE
ncbi:MotA/TolQ/ExbB proton channel family protein [candidate division WOR-3 bacterium]|nr:MotA/TolQ/ExbB proton channel family protein [candidate division WOR-3 bacterium]